MKATILPNGDLEITITTREQRELRKAKREREDFDSDRFMREFMSRLIDDAQSDFVWSSPEEVGALTDAPILRDFDGHTWGFMNYQVVSVQSDLLNYRTCTWQSGD